MDDLLAQFAVRIAAWATEAGISKFFKQREDVLSRAIQATTTCFPEIEGTETALRKWTSCGMFLDLFERAQAGERNLDDDAVASFIDAGEFYLPAEEESTKVARTIVSVFMVQLVNALYASDEGLAVFAHRSEVLHLDMKAHVDKGLAALRDELSRVAPKIVPEEPSASGTLTDSSHIKLAVKIDVARELIDRGEVSSARLQLKRLQDEAKAAPATLRFRIFTSLGACDIAEGNFSAGRTMLEKAYNLCPESQKGIANAAVAAHLTNDSARALELAHKARALDVRSSSATAVLISELWKARDGKRLEDLITTENWTTKDLECGRVLAGIRMQQSRFGEAVAICRSLVETNPNDADAHLALSECLLNHSEADRHLEGYTDELIGQLQEAEREATRGLDLLEHTELRTERRKALVIRGCTRAALGKTTEAIGDFDYILDEIPDHPDAAFNKSLLLLSEDRPEEARPLLDGILDSERQEEATLLLADAYLAVGDAAATVKLLEGTIKLDSPSWQEVHRAEMLCKAEVASGDANSVDPALEEALQRNPHDPKLLTLRALCCNALGKPVDIENLFANALEHADEADRRQILINLGTYYQTLGRFSEAADRFTEVVDGGTLHPAAVPLLICLARSGRLHEALEWARKIRMSSRHSLRIVIEIQAYIFEMAGDMHAAVGCRNDLCSLADSTQSDQVRLASAQFRCGDRDEARTTIHGIDPLQLCHDPESILLLAQLKRVLFMPGFLEDAYLARRCGLKNPTVHLGYQVMFMGQEKEMMEPTAAGPGCAVLLKRESKRRWLQILDEGEESHSLYELHPSDELAQRLLGTHVGDTVVLRDDLEDLSYEVQTIQSKFVRAFQETNEEFSTQFPGHTGLWSLEIKDKDFTKFFQVVDQRNQMVLELKRLYLERPLPFVSFSSLLGRSALEVWRACTEMATAPVRFGSGAHEDTKRAESLIRQADNVALDMLALLTVHRLGVVDLLRKRFQTVAVPQLVIDELQNTFASTVIEPAHAGSLGKEFVRTLLEFAESFERISSYPLLRADKREDLIENLTNAGAGAIYAGDDQMGSNLLIVSDDFGLSIVARSRGINSVNTQDLLEELRRSDIITSEAYSSWIEQLTSLNYSFVRVRPEDIVGRLEVNGYMTTDGTRAMIKTLEGPSCDEDSAVSVGSEVIALLDGCAPREQVELIFLLVIETLKRGRSRRQVLLKFKKALASRFSLITPTRGRLLQILGLYI